MGRQITTDTLGVEQRGRGKRGRQQLRWEGYDKRDVRKAEEGDKWTGKLSIETNGKRQTKNCSSTKNSLPHPFTQGTTRENTQCQIIAALCILMFVRHQ